MANTDEGEDWKIYWKINVRFHTSFLAKEKFRCMWCGKDVVSLLFRRSDFALSAVKCSAGHVPGFDALHMLGVCTDCDADLVQRVTERRQECFQKGCRRFASVDKSAVVRRLGKTALVENFLSLVDQHRAYNCEGCYTEEITPEQFPGLQPTNKCQHDPTQCGDCLQRDIEARINAGEWRTIKCPNKSCNEELTPRDVDKFVSPEVFEAYNKEKTLEALSQHPKYRLCHDSKCGNGLLVDVNDLDPTWKCSRCTKVSCFKCKEAGHRGKTCEQSRKLKPQLEEIEATLRKICKRCPRQGCQRYIQKIRGCTHMICTKSGQTGCETKFCWKCKVIFAKKNCSYEYRHLPGCPMIGGTYEAKGAISTVPRPDKGNALYADGWDDDPDYEAGDSDTERWM